MLVHEDSSLGSTYKLPLEVEFPKGSIILIIIIMSYIPCIYV
ncbi:MAG TPA: palindromic element RPE1 domain-containing protein [Rickettsia endosymbiont of Omalisus fontisbellaquei]|nr:palindromic element RPE1 domain-containing protein [Rickettsia endosymbiont of Omalisus fontisbellaquei]